MSRGPVGCHMTFLLVKLQDVDQMTCKIDLNLVTNMEMLYI